MIGERACPRGCGSLEVRVSRGIEVDLCPGCGGIWLDPGEFDTLIAERFAGEPLEAFFALTSEENDESPLRCPADASSMYVVEFDDMELDWCPECNGIWVDGGERRTIARRSTLSRSTETRRPLRQPEKQHPGERVIDFSQQEPAEPSMEPDEGRGPREIEFEPVGEVPELALDRVAMSPDSTVTVHCASCGAEYPRQNTMQLMDAYWCETCVVEGDFPGANGPPVARRLADAAMAMSKARVELEDKREAAETWKKVNEAARRQRWSPGQPGDDIRVGIRAAARALKSLFSREG